MTTTRSSRLRRLAPLAAAVLALGVFGATTSAGPASAAAQKWYSWDHDLHSGDCTLFGGAKWTIDSDGHAWFDGTVTSSSNDDAWLMWAELRDSNGAVLTTLHNVHYYDYNDQAKFSQNLPNKHKKYRWFADGSFNKNLYPLVAKMNLRSHC